MSPMLWQKLLASNFARATTANTVGTVHVLEAARTTPSVKAIVVVTTDKCYENKEWAWGYRENEPMGGHDPYSNSKGCAELVTSAYRNSFLQSTGIALASARAGNVIGGGDWAADRLVPDILRAFELNQSVTIRNPQATRPCQHVLEPLSGYLTLAEHLYTHGQAYAEGWNFGPQDDDAKPVQWIVEHMVNSWGKGASWQQDGGAQPDLGPDAGQPIISVLQCKRITTGSTHGTPTSQILKRGHTIEPPQIMRGDQGSLISSCHHDDLGGK